MIRILRQAALFDKLSKQTRRVHLNSLLPLRHGRIFTHGKVLPHERGERRAATDRRHDGLDLAVAVVAFRLAANPPAREAQVSVRGVCVCWASETRKGGYRRRYRESNLLPSVRVQ